MSDDFFGEDKDPEREPRVKVQWPLRAVNVIEGELKGAMVEAMACEAHRAPIIFVEEGEFSNPADYAEMYGALTLSEAVAMQGIVYGDVQEHFRRQLIVARELGEPATKADYVAACTAEDVSPLLERISK